MNGDAFAEHVFIADLHTRTTSRVLQVLSFGANGRKGKYFIPLPQGGATINHHMRMQMAVIADGYVFANDTVRSNFAVGTDLSLGMNDGRRMNHESEKLTRPAA